jgi:mono/diheme cytochrome c family protein
MFPGENSMPSPRRFSCRTALAGLLAATFLAPPVLADAGTRASPVPLLPKYRQECGACHVAYPPALLPVASWQRLAGRLQAHFGTDASLDPATLEEITDWLAAHGGTSRRVREEPPGERITRSAWFIRKHDEVPAAAWKLPAVKSAANCSACHAGAEQGDFNERNVRIPR